MAANSVALISTVELRTLQESAMKHHGAVRRVRWRRTLLAARRTVAWRRRRLGGCSMRVIRIVFVKPTVTFLLKLHSFTFSIDNFRITVQFHNYCAISIELHNFY